MLDRLNKYSAQETADAVGIIADEVETLLDLLDRFFEKTDERDHSRLEKIWPGHEGVSRTLVQQLAKLSRELTPPDDYDPADRNLRA